MSGLYRRREFATVKAFRWMGVGSTAEIPVWLLLQGKISLNRASNVLSVATPSGPSISAEAGRWFVLENETLFSLTDLQFAGDYEARPS